MLLSLGTKVSSFFFLSFLLPSFLLFAEFLFIGDLYIV